MISQLSGPYSVEWPSQFKSCLNWTLPLCLNLRYNKCLFIFASCLGHKTVRDNEVPQLTIQTKYNEVSKIFFTSLGSDGGWEISIQTNFWEFSAIGRAILTNHSTGTNWLIWWGAFILAFLWHTIWKKETGSKTDLEPCIFSTNERPFFISQIGKITQLLNKKLYQRNRHRLTPKWIRSHRP